MNKPIIATVITYNPDADVINNILSYYHKVEKLVVIDNSEEEPLAFLDSLTNYPKIILIKNRQNSGIGKALNIAASKAISLNYSWMLTMDQDSKFDSKQLQNYIQCFDDIGNHSIGVIGISFFESKKKQPYQTICSHGLTDTVITSGSIVNLEAWQKVNGFNEDLFIDGVDDEFCFRLTLNNFSVIKLNNISLDHQLGTDILVRNWHVGPIVKRNIHSPVRIYYMVRNYLYLIKRYKRSFPAKTTEYRKTLFYKIKNNLLYSAGRFTLLNYIARGVIDANKKKLGKFEG